MTGRIRIFVNVLLLSLSSAAVAQKPDNTWNASAIFSERRTNAPVGGGNIFWMAGGTGGFSYPVWRNISAAIEVGGQHTGNIPGFNVGLSLFSGMGGVQMRFPTRTKFQPFGQALFGGVHGFDGYFPVPVGRLPTSYDTSFVMAIGGGVDVAVSRHIWIRAVQADYHYSELRNIQGNRQNQFRIGAGIVLRGGGK
jgi:outer membrane immunogenic protein